VQRVSTADHTEGSLRVSLTEYAILAIVAERPQHGFAVARLLAPEGEIGEVYAVARPAVYRAIDRLVDSGMIEPLTAQPGDRGPERTPLSVTKSGRRELEAWLGCPVQHVREVRTGFLLKVVLLERRGLSPLPLIRSQIDVLTPVVNGIEASYPASPGAVALWRKHAARATLRFLQELSTRSE
jgi:PadR family transcriptional regulator AphA